MKKKNTLRVSAAERAFDWFNVVLLFFLMVITLYPRLYVLFASFSDPARFALHQGILLRPQGFSLSSYTAVWKNPMIGRGYLNTLSS